MSAKKPKYKLSPQGEFVIENYNFAKPFANFFPGIAGPYGIPMWVFYVNRGQAIASFGTKDKDHAILEFLPANKSWQMTSLQGFRSFIKVLGAKTAFFYEPFQNSTANSAFNLANRMRLTSYGLKLEEDNLTMGLAVGVEYFTIPNDNFAALARILTIKNTAKTGRKIQLIDGLPQIVPFGTNNFFLKNMSRTIEAWMNVKNLNTGVPFYKLAVDPTDKPELIHIEEGNFYLAFHYEKGKPKIIKPIVEPQHIFGPIADFTSPYLFLRAKNFHYPKLDIADSKTPSGFLFSGFTLPPFKEKIFYSVIGYMRNEKNLNSSIRRITEYGYLTQKGQENKKIIEELQKDIKTVSSSNEFNLYAGQTYLDNILRGGYPIKLESDSHSAIFYLYSRKHADLERDYNKFQLQPTYFSQGNGNYRDINQNRRCDVWFNPDIKEENVVTFFNLLQPDGFNPLLVKEATFSLKNPGEFKALLKNLLIEETDGKLFSFLDKPFTPGDVIIFIEENKIELNLSHNEFLNLLLPHSKKNQEAEHSDGFWTDHWTYNLDLLEGYLGVYPESLKEIVFDKKVFTFYDNIETVKPRAEKYVLYEGKIRQLHSIVSDTSKKEMLRKRTVLPHIVRKQYGEGEIYETSLINKMLCLVANKMASLDPFGVGIEMEADKPNWYDALNGLPALSGSSLCETFELKRLLNFIKNALLETNTQNLAVTEEIYNLLAELNALTKEYSESSSNEKDYRYWDKTHLAKEQYRLKTRFGFSGNESEMAATELIEILDIFSKKICSGIDKAYDSKKGIYYAYFINEVSQYEPLKGGYVKPTAFLQKKLPFFLEPQVHALKITTNTDKAKSLYEAVKKSPLYDKKLKMYKVTASLSDMPEEIGRCRVFTPGWLENESIWLHMEYKYLLEILRCGLYEEFYKEFKCLLIPFQKPQSYGRSILENSSFLVSSRFPDKNLHGNGFVARLSGSTAEFLHIWLIMHLGARPFFLNEQKELNLRFEPILAGWLFNQKGIYTFNFLSKIMITLHNPKRKNTFGANGVKIKRITFDDKNGKPLQIPCDTIPSPFSSQIRNREIADINLYFE